MTEAKTKQAARMVKAGTPLTEVADVLGVSRTTLYRHLKTTSPSAAAAAVSASVVPASVARSVVGERAGRACPSCGHEPATREEAMALRADLAVLWLHPDPDPDNPGAVVEARHCRSCQPHGAVVDVECTRCGGWAHHHRGPRPGQCCRVGGLPGPPVAGGRWLGHCA